MNLADTRQMLADAVTAAAPTLTVKAYPFAQPKPLDGWVVVERLSVASFRAADTRFNVFVILGTDLPSAERHVDTYAPALMAATAGLLAAGVAVEVREVPVGAGVSNAPLYALTLSLTLEVD